jgi:hypothetical protein
MLRLPRFTLSCPTHATIAAIISRLIIGVILMLKRVARLPLPLLTFWRARWLLLALLWPTVLLEWCKALWGALAGYRRPPTQRTSNAFVPACGCIAACAPVPAAGGRGG